MAEIPEISIDPGPAFFWIGYLLGVVSGALGFAACSLRQAIRRSASP